MKQTIIKYDSVLQGLKELGKKAMTFKQVMEERIKDDSLWDTWLDARTFCLYSPNGKVKITNEIDLEKIDTFSKEDYENCTSKEIDITNIKINEPLTQVKVLNNPIWKELCENDLGLLKRYVTKADENNCFRSKGMGIYIGTESKDYKAWPWCVGDSSDYSLAGVRYDFDNYGRFLRVHQEEELFSDKLFKTLSKTKTTQKIFELTEECGGREKNWMAKEWIPLEEYESFAKKNLEIQDKLWKKVQDLPKLKEELRQTENRFSEVGTLAEMDIEEATKKINELKEALLDVLAQACVNTYDGNKDVIDIDNQYISAYKDACILLEKEGMLTKVNDRIYKIKDTKL